MKIRSIFAIIVSRFTRLLIILTILGASSLYAQTFTEMISDNKGIAFKERFMNGVLVVTKSGETVFAVMDLMGSHEKLVSRIEAKYGKIVKFLWGGELEVKEGKLINANETTGSLKDRWSNYEKENSVEALKSHLYGYPKLKTLCAPSINFIKYDKTNEHLHPALKGIKQIAHDFKSPINIIWSVSQMLNEKKEREAENVLTLQLMLVEAAGRILELHNSVQDLLGLSIFNNNTKDAIFKSLETLRDSKPLSEPESKDLVEMLNDVPSHIELVLNSLELKYQFIGIGPKKAYNKPKPTKFNEDVFLGNLEKGKDADKTFRLKDMDVLVITSKNKELIEYWLRSQGLIADIVTNSEDALSLLSVKRYDVVFTDVKAPTEEAITNLVKVIRTHSARNKNVAIIATTTPEDAFMMENPYEELYKAGFDGYSQLIDEKLDDKVSVWIENGIIKTQNLSPIANESSIEKLNEVKDDPIWIKGQQADFISSKVIEILSSYTGLKEVKKIEPVVNGALEKIQNELGGTLSEETVDILSEPNILEFLLKYGEKPGELNFSQKGLDFVKECCSAVAENNKTALSGLDESLRNKIQKMGRDIKVELPVVDIGKDFAELNKKTMIEEGRVEFLNFVSGMVDAQSDITGLALLNIAIGRLLNMEDGGVFSEADLKLAAKIITSPAAAEFVKDVSLMIGTPNKYVERYFSGKDMNSRVLELKTSEGENSNGYKFMKEVAKISTEKGDNYKNIRFEKK